MMRESTPAAGAVGATFEPEKEKAAIPCAISTHHRESSFRVRRIAEQGRFRHPSDLGLSGTVSGRVVITSAALSGANRGTVATLTLD